jgi:type VI protein secretion system component Hcp|tara:strand:+ start:820 stop:1773 length:954 start_codon:yes stop_codon:yes gene_type:complete
LLILSPSLEAYDAYLQLSKGGQPVANDGNSSWVQIRGFSQGVENPVNVGSATGGLGSGKVEGDTVTLHIVSNGLIAEMMKGVAMGDLYEIKLQLARRGTDEAYTSVMTEIVFDKVVFSKVATGATDGDDALVFDVSYKYGELTVKHTAIDLAENVTSTTGAGWTFIGNEPISVNTSVPQLGDYSSVTPPPPNLDRDNDLMPNEWETKYSLNPDSNSDAGQDPDMDGFTNLHEYIAGTHPRKSNSFFKITTTLKSTSPSPTVELSWAGIAGRTYQVEASSNLKTGFAVIHTIIPATTGAQTYQPANGTGPYFRLSVKN